MVPSVVPTDMGRPRRRGDRLIQYLVEGIVRIATGVILLIIVAGLAACHAPLFFLGNHLLRLTAGIKNSKIVLDRID